MEEFLNKNNLTEYFDQFKNEGYDDLQFLEDIPEIDLIEILENDIKMKKGHSKKFQLRLKAKKCLAKDGIPIVEQLTSTVLPDSNFPASVRELLLPAILSDKQRFFNETVKSIYKDSFLFMTPEAFSAYAASQRALRWNLYKSLIKFEINLASLKDSKDGTDMNIVKFTSEKYLFISKDFNKITNSINDISKKIVSIESFKKEIEKYRSSLFSADHTVSDWKTNELQFYSDYLKRANLVLEKWNELNSRLMAFKPDPITREKSKICEARRVEKRKRENRCKSEKESKVRLLTMSVNVLKVICRDMKSYEKKIMEENFDFIIEMSNLVTENFANLIARFSVKGLELLIEKVVFAEYDGSLEAIQRLLKELNEKAQEVSEKNLQLKEKKNKKELSAAKQHKITKFCIEK